MPRPSPLPLAHTLPAILAASLTLLQACGESTPADPTGTGGTGATTGTGGTAGNPADEFELLFALSLGGVYGTPLDGSTPSRRITPPLVEGGIVSQFLATPDRSRLVFVADAETDGLRELFVVNLDGTNPQKLSPPLVAEGGVGLIRLTPDGSRVVYIARAETETIAELYVVNLDGTNNRKLSVPLVEGPGVQNFELTPDGSRVVYGTRDELFAVDLDGTDSVRLSPRPKTSSSLALPFRFRIAPNGSRVVLVGDFDFEGIDDAYAVNLDGSGLTRLNPPLFRDPLSVVLGSVTVATVTPDSSRVLLQTVIDRTRPLYSATLEGTDFQRLHPALDVGQFVRATMFTADGSRVVFTGDVETEDAFNLYTTRLDGSGFLRLNPPLVSSGFPFIFGDVEEFAITPDGSRVAYVGRIGEQVALYAVDIDATNAQQLATPADVERLVMGPDGSKVFYTDSAGTPGVQNLFVANLDGTGTDRLHPPFVDPPGVDHLTPAGFLELSPDGTRMVFIARTRDPEAPGRDIRRQLYSVTTDGTDIVELVPPPGAPQSIRNFLFLD